MSDARTIADRYISRAGGSPTWNREEFARDLLTLGSFILWHEINDLRGGVRPPEAFLAMCRLLNVEPHKIREKSSGRRRARAPSRGPSLGLSPQFIPRWRFGTPTRQAALVEVGL